MLVSPVGELELTPGPGYESGGEMERPMYVITEAERSTHPAAEFPVLPSTSKAGPTSSNPPRARRTGPMGGTCLTRHECYRGPIVQRSSPQSQHTHSVSAVGVAAIASTTGREVHALPAANVLDFFFCSDVVVCC